MDVADPNHFFKLYSNIGVAHDSLEDLHLKAMLNDVLKTCPHLK